MAKTNTPFFSLGASGSVGRSITAQKRGSTTLLREKPLPTYRQTLPQLYQRWLYEDYAYLWRQQSAATRAGYRTGGSRFHLTGFQYWMKYHLANLPDIAAWWKLDEGGGAIAYDSGRNDNNGVIIGASPTDGYIGRAFLLDGTNDWIVIPTTPSLDLRTAQTFECLFNLETSALSQYFFNKGIFANEWLAIAISPIRGLYFYTKTGGVLRTTTTAAGAFNWGDTHHLLCTLDPPNARIYLDAVDITTVFGAHVSPNPTTQPTYIGVDDSLLNRVKGILDNVIYYNRVLDLTEIQRHSLRRYPS